MYESSKLSKVRIWYINLIYYFINLIWTTIIHSSLFSDFSKVNFNNFPHTYAKRFMNCRNIFFNYERMNFLKIISKKYFNNFSDLSEKISNSNLKF